MIKLRETSHVEKGYHVSYHGVHAGTYTDEDRLFVSTVSHDYYAIIKNSKQFDNLCRVIYEARLSVKLNVNMDNSDLYEQI